MAEGENQEDKAQLDLAYFYTLDKKLQPPRMNVVWELSSKDRDFEAASMRRTPLRFVAVIDESGSMNNKVGEDNMTLIQRMKVFAELMVQNLKEDDQMAIVTFATDIQVKLPMTQLNEDGKAQALEAIKTLRTRGQTNLSDGLLAALEMFQSGGLFHNGIVLFTDGAANQGITNADHLIQAFNEKKASVCGEACIPISTFTIGHYRPHLLYEVSQKLGSDAFFWLSDDSNFEADMMIPIFLRETCLVSNVRVSLHALHGLTFEFKSMGSPLMTAETSQLRTGTEAKYFMHDISEDMKKHIPCVLNLPADWETTLPGNDVMYAIVTYVGTDHVERELHAQIPFYHDTVEDLIREVARERDTKQSDDTKEGNVSIPNRKAGHISPRSKVSAVNDREEFKFPMKTTNTHKDPPGIKDDTHVDIPEACSHIIAHTSDLPHQELNKVQRAEIAIVTTMQEDSRVLTVDSMNKAATCIRRGEDKSWVPHATRHLQEGINIITQKQDEVKTLVSAEACLQVTAFTTSMKDNLDFCVTLLEPENFDPCHWARMKAMASCLANETPTAGAVFGKNRQPFVPPKLATKIQKVTAEVAKQKGHDVPEPEPEPEPEPVSSEPPPPPPAPAPVVKPKPKNKPKSPETVKRLYRDAKSAKAVRIAKPFKNQQFTLSEKLVAGKIAKNSTETIKELVIKHGGTPVPFVQNSVLVCTKAEYDKKTGKVRDAIANKIPIVFEEFIYDSIKAKKMLDIEDYRF